ncbi:SubName: Full=Related to SSP120-secretory protein {ECO:0000313/EMBL:CCA67170.1} [Serendipita indica DSM 11827]|nr:SubName: Full=Related to SSP120-secretory protein {ECO:0000313/EMBL:CCA67170.1} [Serendipita indica DSM 11827]
MSVARILLLGLIAGVVRGHGGHDQAPDDKEWDAKSYAEQHMHREHHIDSFDLASFFKLHDLNGDGYWDKAEIEAVYGVHHEYSKAKTPDEQEQQAKADKIVDAVLKRMDTNGNGLIDKAEFEAAGWEGLPSFKSLGADGHHYDVESEFFLHHEEVFHSTPETQTDDAYVHPEDIEHFEQHEKIELEEENKERAYQGLPPFKNLREAEAAREKEIADAKAEASRVPGRFARQQPPERQDPKIKFKDAGAEAENKPEWGEGDEAYMRPKTPAEKLRKNVPYKYKFRRNWGDF